MDAKQNFLLYAFPVLILAALIEALLYRRIRQQPFAWKESAASLVVAIGYQAHSMAGFALASGMFAYLYSLRPFDIAMDRWYHWVGLFFGLEFCYYWFHRMSHEIRWFWASHAVHHSPEHLNFSVAYRLAWTGYFTGVPLFFAPLILIGFQPAYVFGMLGINLLYQFWLHTELIPRLPLLELVFNSPSLHRVHHATNPKYLDMNYGGVLIIFDRLFGTYVAEDDKDPCRYGLITQVGSNNPVKIAFHEWIKLAKDLRTAKSLKDIVGFLFARPGWRPDGKGLTTKNLRMAESGMR